MQHIAYCDCLTTIGLVLCVFKKVQPLPVPLGVRNEMCSAVNLNYYFVCGFEINTKCTHSVSEKNLL